MKIISAIFIFFSLLQVDVFGQRLALMANDTANLYYSKTDFYNVDSLDNWTFSLEKELLFDVSDSIQPVYKLTFSRIDQINNYSTLFKQLDSVSWKVFVTYKIYKLADSTYCFQKSAQVRKKTNFIPPFAGGDYFIIGKFIFLNTDACLACIQYETKRDFCRPVVNAIISKIDRSRPFSVEGIVRQFPIRRVVVEPPSNRMKRKYRS